MIAIALGVTSLGMFYMPAFAFVGAFVSVGITIILTLRNNKLDTTTLLLAGVAVSMLLGAFTSGILTMINEYRLREFLFWMVGGLDFVVGIMALAVGPIVTGSVILMMLGRHLNVLVLGDTEARAFGLSLLWCIVCYSYFLHLLLQLLLYVSVVLIGFVGLVVPHIVRLLVGPDHRILRLWQLLEGHYSFVFCDTLGRIIAQPVEIRVGIMTDSLRGTIFFIFASPLAQ